MIDVNTKSNTAAKTPTVSVCIASYNHAEYLGEMLDSVLAQTYKDFEVIVVDDGSTDNSLQILEDYARRFDNVKVFTHPNRENRGISATANLAISKAQGEFVSFIGSDDVWYPDIMELQLRAFRKDPGVGLVYGRSYLISKNGEMRDGIFGRDITQSPSPLEELVAENVMPALTIMVKRECMDQFGGFNENLVYSDWELSIKVLSRFKAAFVDKPLGKYRIHDRNTSTGSGVAAEKVFSDSRAVLLSIKSEVDSFDGESDSISTAIDRGLENIEKKLANTYLDNYFRELYGAGSGRNYGLLKKAWHAAPKEVCRPRRLGAIVKSFFAA